MTKTWDYLIPDEEFESIIRNYCTDYTKLEKEGRFDPITGRDKEIDDTILIMLQKGRKNVAFLAGAGIGKTAMVVGLAQAIVAGNVPDLLKDARVIEVDLSKMSAGTASKAEFQGRFIPFMKGVSERYHNPDEPRYILFFDEIHQIMPSAVGSSFAGLSDTLKTYLTTGEILVLGATTLDEYRIYVAEDNALDRRFQKITLKAPNEAETYVIMKALRKGLEAHHRITIPNELLLMIVKLTDEHMRKRNQPDKSIITADAAMAYHVKEHGIDQELAKESIYYMLARETGKNALAMHDEKLVQALADEVAILEGEKEVAQDDDADAFYDPYADVQDVEMDKDYQAELAAEQEEAERRIKESEASDEDKKAQLESLEEKMAEKLAEKLEQKLEEKVDQKVDEKLSEKQG